MIIKKSWWSMGEKVCIVLQTLNPQDSIAEIYREHNLAPRTVYDWKEKLLVGGRGSLEGSDTSRQITRHKKEIVSLKRIIDEYTVANNALKKALEGRLE